MTELEKKFIEFYQNIGRGYGLDSLFLTIFAKLYISPEETAMDDLVGETGYSLASISNKVKELENAGLVRKTKRPGRKKIHEEPKRNAENEKCDKCFEAARHIFDFFTSVFRKSSFSCFFETKDGASIIRSLPSPVLGKAIISLMLDSFCIIITNLSRPKAIPPCGGSPYLKIWRKCPKFSFISLFLYPIISKTASNGFGRWFLMLPPPTS